MARKCRASKEQATSKNGGLWSVGKDVVPLQAQGHGKPNRSHEVGLLSCDSSQAEWLADVATEVIPEGIGQGEKDFNDTRVKLGARATTNFCLGSLKRKGFAVGAVGDHSVKGVGHPQNRRPQRYR